MWSPITYLMIKDTSMARTRVDWWHVYTKGQTDPRPAALPFSVACLAEPHDTIVFVVRFVRFKSLRERRRSTENESML